MPAMSRARREPPPTSVPLKLAVFAGDSVAVHDLPPSGSITIGRAADSDVRIEHASVSRRHAILHLGAPVRIEDLGSVNGTFVRTAAGPAEAGGTHELRQLLKQTEEFAVGDTVNVGSVMLVLRRAPLPGEDGAGAGLGDGPVIQDPAMRALYEEARRVAASPISVLILGQTGVGKEVLARVIHQRSPRAKGPFLALNCAALSESLLESELFGHEKGAFTGAVEARPGLFEAAATGTVFLDEVGELPMSVQVKLLRVIEDRTVLRVGGRAPRPIDVRFVSATHRDLDDEVARGAFRQDLFFRLNGIALTIPPLRERPAEIVHLAQRFLAGACRQIDRPTLPAISREALSALERYPWPGNIRELRNVIERAAVLCAGDALLPEHLPAKLLAVAAHAPRPHLFPPTEATPAATPPAPSEKLREEISALERRRILDALEQCAGNQTQAAALLGMPRRTLIARIEAYDIPRPRKRSPR
jgi:DNA-binding NtrC family response regulator